MPPTPPDKLAFWGAILGAIIGTLGAFGVAYITVREDRKLAKEALDVERKKERKAREEEKRKEKERFEKEQLRSYGRRLFTYEVSLNGFIPILLKN